MKHNKILDLVGLYGKNKLIIVLFCGHVYFFADPFWRRQLSIQGACRLTDRKLVIQTDKRDVSTNTLHQRQILCTRGQSTNTKQL